MRGDMDLLERNGLSDSLAELEHIYFCSAEHVMGACEQDGLQQDSKYH